MLFALGAASSAIDALTALTSSKSSSAQSTGFGQDSASPFDLSSAGSTATGPVAGAGGGGCGAQISPATMNALLAAQSQSSTAPAASTPSSPLDALKDLFSQIDANGDGQITQSEFENALGAGGTNLAQADDVFGKLDKDGNGSVSLDELSAALKGGGHHQHSPAGAPDDPTDSGPLASSATASASGAATSSYSFIDQMIAREAKAISSSMNASLSISA